jgi:hypothetical protein
LSSIPLSQPDCYKKCLAPIFARSIATGEKRDRNKPSAVQKRPYLKLYKQNLCGEGTDAVNTRHNMEGYAKVAHLMGTHGEFGIFRRFQTLNMQNLLYLQAEITHLEAELRQGAYI